MIKFKGINWYPYHGILLPKIPPHQEVVLSQNEQTELLKKSKAYLLRWTSDWDGDESEFWYIVKDDFKGMGELSGNTRNQIRKAQKYCTVKKVTYQEIANNGYESYKCAFDSYNTDLKPVSKELFYDNMMKSNNYDFFAVYKKDDAEMIAYSSNTINNDVCSYTTIKLHPKYLKLYSGYILFYEMNKYYLDDKKFKYIHDGARSISHDTNIHTFLVQKFKFRKVYCRLHIAYRNDIALFVKFLYPFKTLISKLNFSIANKITVLLKQEEIRRSFE